MPVWLLGGGVSEEEREEPSSARGETLVLEGPAAMRLAVRLALAATAEGEFRRSRDILKRVVSAPQFRELPPEDRVAAWFALGQAFNALGDHGEAVAAYRRILEDHPEWVRVRLELARSFFFLGEDELADYHFRFALAGELPENVAANVKHYLREIRLRRRWSFDLGFRFVHNTNVNLAPTIRQIELQGIPLELHDDARAKSGVGVGGFVSGEHRQPLGARAQARMGGLLDHTSYSDSRFNDTIVAGHFGPHLLFETGRLGEAGGSLLVQGYRRWFGGRKLNYGLGPVLEFTAEPGERFYFSVRVEHLLVRYDESDDFDGRVTSAVFRPVRVLSPLSFANLTLGVSYDRTDFEALRNWQYRLGLGYQADFSRGFTLGFQPEYRYVSYRFEWEQFGQRRRDHLIQFRAHFLNRRIDFFGFTPVVGYLYQHRSSTIDLYDFDQHRLELNLTRRF